MSITSINSSTQTASSNPARAEAAGTGVAATLAGIATAATEGVSATVSFSGQALHALEQAGESVIQGVEDTAVGAWHALQRTASEAEHVGEEIVDAISEGAHEIVATGKTLGKELGHYAAVGLSATGEAVSEVASGTVMAAAAVGKGIAALL